MKSIMFGRRTFRFARRTMPPSLRNGVRRGDAVRRGQGLSGLVTILPTDVPVLPNHQPVDAAAPGEQPAVVDPTRVQVHVVTTSNCLSVVEFRVRLDMVEAWFGHDLRAVFDRERLRAWLVAPAGRLADGDVVFNADPRSRGERIAIGLSEVLAWTLSPKELHQLRELV
jgi:hypothetical protein